ncbi:alpha-L-arabinofuranosidase [Herbiconiux sp. CPCC 205716]|uniref:non-reducing end alpha-L-arabinofuranosidase n=1 Tax=Herbiconiux gentiana TaxID=2970912 RepID=A0ABT2GAF6_9MICO|nr:alpha-L-arabinofuranosidase C-terminal domain-containing protein [Herbiconiux gentiana]MCS5713172.1 alpha-L-arabinofuranosidase [Herbiconiux gentiana]
MLTASIVVDRRFTSGTVPRRLFGGFIEQAGRGVYHGLFEPEHPLADSHGFRRDVIELIRELGVTTVRYPGGNYVSGHRWEDGTGPVDLRPSRLDLAWHATEPNTFGLDEFITWSSEAGVEPMLALNLGTRGVLEALDMLEYCNGAGGTFQADRRRANGFEKPFDVRMWCLGNEPDGHWQLGHTDAAHYGLIARQTASAMRMFDPTLELVVAGSSGTEMATYGSWERTVLEASYDDVDFISAHQYYYERDGDLASYLASSTDFDAYIRSVIATIDHVRSVKRSSRIVNVSVDEWGVWYQPDHVDEVPAGLWPVGGHRLEDFYSTADAVVYGSMLITLLKHVDRVRSASIAQLVNVIAPIMTVDGGEAWKQTIFHPFAQASASIGDMVLQTLVTSTPMTADRFGEVPAVDAVATFDDDAGVLRIFVVNRSHEPAEFAADLSSFGQVFEGEMAVLASDEPRRKGAGGELDPRPRVSPLRPTHGQLAVTLAPVSWSTLTVQFGAR